VYFDKQSFAIFVTLPTSFLVTFLLTRQVIDQEFSKNFELRGDKFRGLKKRKHYFQFQKAKL